MKSGVLMYVLKPSAYVRERGGGLEEDPVTHVPL